MRRPGVGLNRRTGARGFGGGVAPAFTPASLSPVRWYRADNAALVSTHISALVDMGSDAANAGQTTDAQRPIQVTKAGQLAAQFTSASSQWLTAAALAGTASHAFFVCQVVTDPPAASGSAGFARSGSSGTVPKIPFTDGVVYDSWGSTTRQTTANPAADMSTQPRVYEAISSATEWTNKLDGTQLFTTGTNTVGFDTALSIGSDTGGGFLNGWLWEIVCFNRKLTTPERASLIAYFNARYTGLASA